MLIVIKPAYVSVSVRECDRCDFTTTKKKENGKNTL